MTMPLDTIAAAAMQLPPAERRQLIRGLAISLDGEPDDTPQGIAPAWHEEIGRRLEQMDRGETVWVSGEDALRRIRAAACGE